MKVDRVQRWIGAYHIVFALAVTLMSAQMIGDPEVTPGLCWFIGAGAGILFGSGVVMHFVARQDEED